MGGANGTKENLPVGIEVLLEMAGYCERVYDDGKEVADNEFSYDVIQDRQAVFLDSPSTTSATTYKVQVAGLNSRDTLINRTYDDGDTSDTPRVASSITVMEVSA